MSANLTFVLFRGTLGETAKVIPSVGILCTLLSTLCPSSFWGFSSVDVCWFVSLEFDVCMLAVVGEIPDCITSPWPNLHSDAIRLNAAFKSASAVKSVEDPATWRLRLFNSLFESVEDPATWRLTLSAFGPDVPASVARMVVPVRDWSLNRLIGKSQCPLLASRI